MELLEIKLKAIADVREQKGKERKALDLISEAEKEAKLKKDFISLTKLGWEKSLVWQHLAMGERGKDKPNEEKIKKYITRMTNAALDAHKIINEHNLEKLLPTSYRFLGRVNTYQNKHDEAQKSYETAIKLLRRQGDKEKILEINGFLAHSLIMNGETKEGIHLAKDTYKAFKESKEGRDLKKRDYFTWGVWISGIFPRILGALVEKNVVFEKKDITKYLDECEDLLKNPQGNIKWGDPKFQFRRDEISKSKSILDKIVMFCLVTLPAFAGKVLR